MDHVDSTPYVKCIVPIVGEQKWMVNSGINAVNIEQISQQSYQREQFHRHPHCKPQDERDQRTSMNK